MKARSFNIFTSLVVDSSLKDSFPVTGTIAYTSQDTAMFQSALPVTGTEGDVHLFVTNTTPDPATGFASAQVSISKRGTDPSNFHIIFITAK